MGYAVTTGLGIIGQVMGYNAQAKQAKAQGKAAITQMNYSFQNYEMERQDAFDSAVNDIINTRLQAQTANAAVDNAVNERLGSGNTASLLKRSVRGDEARRVASIQSNYQQKSNEIDLNKESQLISTKSYIANIKTPSKTALALGIASNALGAYTAGKEAETQATLKDLDFDWDNYWWQGSGTIKKKTTT